MYSESNFSAKPSHSCDSTLIECVSHKVKEEFVLNKSTDKIRDWLLNLKKCAPESPSQISLSDTVSN